MNDLLVHFIKRLANHPLRSEIPKRYPAPVAVIADPYRYKGRRARGHGSIVLIALRIQLQSNPAFSAGWRFGRKRAGRSRHLDGLSVATCEGRRNVLGQYAALGIRAVVSLLPESSYRRRKGQPRRVSVLNPGPSLAGSQSSSGRRTDIRRIESPI